MRAWLTHHAWCTRQSWAAGGAAFFSSGLQTRPITKMVLHSTETTTFPGYRSGADNPHFTIDLDGGETRQHVPLTHGARALQILATNQANNGGVVQVEIIGACTPGYPAKHGHYDLVNRLPRDVRAQGFLARLMRAIADETGIPLTSGVEWWRYPGSYGQTSIRLSVNAYLSYRGVLGHMHVPGNTHGDPGVIPIRVILDLARGGADVTPPPATNPGRDGTVFFEGATGPDVKAWQESLATLGYDLEVDSVFGPITTRETRAFQSERRIEVDGRVGKESLTTMEDYMSALEKKIDKLAESVADLAANSRRPVAIDKNSLKAVAVAVWGYTASNIGRRNAFWYLRHGLVTNPEHPAHPADPGSPAEALMLVAEQQTGESATDRMARLEAGVTP